MDNFNVLSLVPNHLHRYWTQEHQSPRWEGNTDRDMRLQETRLRRGIIRYTAKTTRTITTYEYRAPA